jgi:hypothetical protein
MRIRSMVHCCVLPLLAMVSNGAGAQSLPRTADGTPNLQGIWQAATRASLDFEDHVARHGASAGQSIVDGGEIPYQPWAAEQKRVNFENRATADPLGKCFLPGTPRIMTMDFPFHIFQTNEHVAITFEWQQVYRVIYTSGEPSFYPGIESWMGDSRGRWEGDTLVVVVSDQNDKTWFDAAGNFHSDELTVTERYTMRDANTIDYEATIEDAEVFTRPWTIRMPLRRQTQMDRILEYQCQAEKEEANGAFERDLRTWYPAPVPAENQPFDMNSAATLPMPEPTSEIERLADGTPNISGYFSADAGGANYGLEEHERDFLLPGSRGQVIDPPDRLLPYQPWARAERVERILPHRGYDDPTAHCFVAGVPRSHYVPSPFLILQPPGYVVILHERMSWRQIPLDGRQHLPDHMRLWMGDSVGRWEGDTLLVESQNYNGKAWLNEAGDVASHAQTVLETFTPVSATRIMYRATVTDPIPYTRPWTIEMPFNRANEELLEVACLEDNGDLDILRDVRDEYRANPGRGN